MKVNHKHVLLNTYKTHGMKGELRIIIKDFYHIVGGLGYTPCPHVLSSILSETHSKASDTKAELMPTLCASDTVDHSVWDEQMFFSFASLRLPSYSFLVALAGSSSSSGTYVWACAKALCFSLPSLLRWFSLGSPRPLVASVVQQI